jgi:hypothetical protein
VVAASTSPPTTKTRSSTRTTATPTTPISVVGDLCFNACFSQLEPKPPSGGQTISKVPLTQANFAWWGIVSGSGGRGGVGTRSMDNTRPLRGGHTKKGGCCLDRTPARGAGKKGGGKGKERDDDLIGRINGLP